MEYNQALIEAITKAVVKQLNENQGQPAGNTGMKGRTRLRPKRSYAGAVLAEKGTDPKEVVIGVGPAFQREITETITGIPLKDVIRNVCAGIEEEGMVPRVV